MFNYGLYVLTTKSENLYSASTVTWIAQASFEPLLISVAIRNESSTLDILNRRQEFVLHLLGKEQKELAAAFFKSTVVDGNSLNGVPFVLDENDLPLIESVAARLTCKLTGSLCKGDHTLFLAEIRDIDLLDEMPLIDLQSTGWHYGG